MTERNDRLAFEQGPGWLGLFLVVTATVVVVANVAGDALRVGPAIPLVELTLPEVAVDLVGIAIPAWFLWTERVGVDDVGVSLAHAAVAVPGVAAFYVLLNAVGAGLLTTTVGPEAVGYQWTVPPAEAVAAFLSALLFAAVPEELAYRGYLQSKLIAMVPDRTPLRAVVGVLGASVLFAAVHLPRVLTSGVPGTQSAVTYGSLLVLSGLSFGLLYEYTQNLWVPVSIHAAGNMPGTMGIVFFDAGAFRGTWLVAYAVLYLALSVALVWGYRRWLMTPLDLRSWTDRVDTGVARSE